MTLYEIELPIFKYTDECPVLKYLNVVLKLIII